MSVDKVSTDSNSVKPGQVRPLLLAYKSSQSLSKWSFQQFVMNFTSSRTPDRNAVRLSEYRLRCLLWPFETER